MARSSVGVERTPDGRRVCVSRPIDAPAGTVWDLLTDTRRWPEWGPTVSDVDCPDRYVTAGSRGRVRVLRGPWVPFEVTTCQADAPVRRWTWDVAWVPATGHRVTGSRPCRVVFEVPLLGVAYLPVCERALVRIERPSANN
ncbi:polyketide cyclase [Halobacteriales archaeon QS_1_68_17]|nr:MAG: polyketide cyclase [Halobacteriales archaeon QS_1_68_17]